MTIPDHNDPFEKAFYDYHNGKIDAQIIFHNNKGDDEITPVQYFFRTYDEMPELEKLALQNCDDNTLDIGSGSGCHSWVLQNMGKKVTALDIRKGFVDVMKKRGIQDVVHADIMTFKGRKFNTLLMLMNGIGFTQNLKGLAKFLEVSKELLNPGGQILLDSSDLLYMYQEEDGTFKIDLNESYYGEVEYQVEYDGKKGKPFKWMFVDYSNLSFYASQVGYRTELLFEDDTHQYLARLY